MEFYFEKFLSWTGAIMLTLIGIAIPLLLGLAIGYQWNDLIGAILTGLFILEVIGILGYVSYKVLYEEPDR